MDASPLQGFRPPLNLPLPIYTPGPGERHCDSKVSCQRTQHNVPNKAETWTARSRGECTNHEATTPSWLPMLQLKDDVQSVLCSLSPVCDTCRLQTCRLADLQTCRLADLQTCRLADLQTCRPADFVTSTNHVTLDNNIVTRS